MFLAANFSLGAENIKFLAWRLNGILFVIELKTALHCIALRDAVRYAIPFKTAPHVDKRYIDD